jgi:hypothetical protein
MVYVEYTVDGAKTSHIINAESIAAITRHTNCITIRFHANPVALAMTIPAATELETAWEKLREALYDLSIKQTLS